MKRMQPRVCKRREGIPNSLAHCIHVSICEWRKFEIVIEVAHDESIVTIEDVIKLIPIRSQSNGILTWEGCSKISTIALRLRKGEGCVSEWGGFIVWDRVIIASNVVFKLFMISDILQIKVCTDIPFI